VLAIFRYDIGRYRDTVKYEMFNVVNYSAISHVLMTKGYERDIETAIIRKTYAFR
jgi:hypothetical protein